MSEQHPGSQGPEAPRNPKAEARAAKAYAKAERPWYKKKRFWALGLVILAIAGTAGSSSEDPGTDTVAEDTATTETQADEGQTETQTETQAEEPEETAPAPSGDSGPSASFPIQDGDWRLESLRVEDNGLGDFGGTARITYTGDNPDGGSNLFTITVFKGSQDVAALSGSADSVQPGDTETVQLISFDKYVGGSFKYDFQTDL